MDPDPLDVSSSGDECSFMQQRNTPSHAPISAGSHTIRAYAPAAFALMACIELALQTPLVAYRGKIDIAIHFYKHDEYLVLIIIEFSFRPATSLLLIAHAAAGS